MRKAGMAMLAVAALLAGCASGGAGKLSSRQVDVAPFAMTSALERESARGLEVITGAVVQHTTEQAVAPSGRGYVVARGRVEASVQGGGEFTSHRLDNIKNASAVGDGVIAVNLKDGGQARYKYRFAYWWCPETVSQFSRERCYYIEDFLGDRIRSLADVNIQNVYAHRTSLQKFRDNKALMVSEVYESTTFMQRVGRAHEYQWQRTQEQQRLADERAFAERARAQAEEAQARQRYAAIVAEGQRLVDTAREESARNNARDARFKASLPNYRRGSQMICQALSNTAITQQTLLECGNEGNALFSDFLGQGWKAVSASRTSRYQLWDVLLERQ